MDSKITIGITGGIGSGKSIVCRIINTMGYPVFYSDDEAKIILSNDPNVIKEIISIFGNEAYENGILNRPYLATKIFNDDTLRSSINRIVHPLVRKAFANWAQNQNSKLVFNEAAIIFESGAYKNFNHTILVTSPEILRIERIMKRDSISEEKVKSRMSKQWTDEEKIKLTEFIISNNEIDLVIPQVIKIIDQLNKRYENI